MVTTNVGYYSFIHLANMLFCLLQEREKYCKKTQITLPTGNNPTKLYFSISLPWSFSPVYKHAIRDGAR